MLPGIRHTDDKDILQKVSVGSGFRKNMGSSLSSHDSRRDDYFPGSTDTTPLRIVKAYLISTHSLIQLGEKILKRSNDSEYLRWRISGTHLYIHFHIVTHAQSPKW